MNRIDRCFIDLQAQGRKALIPYVTCGDPDLPTTLNLMHAMVEAGANVIELGVPFSDPMADGPVIQRACERALKHNVGLVDVLQLVRRFRSVDELTPVVLMGYANPIERYNQRLGQDAFVLDAGQAGVDGVLVVDYPPEECEAFALALSANNMAPIFLLAPTSSDQRIQTIAHIGRGYVYYVSLKGVTGSASLDVTSVAQMMQRIRAHVKIAVGVGFGIRDAHSAVQVAQVADAVVIGSRIIEIIEQSLPEQASSQVGAFVKSIRLALDDPNLKDHQT
jgi:tryptophan synthase alpha chain